MSRTCRTVLLGVLTVLLQTEHGHALTYEDTTSADFLQSVIRRMQYEKFINSGEDLAPDYRPTPATDHYVDQDSSAAAGEEHAPPLSKGELLALYQAAITKGSGLNLSSLPQLPLSSESAHSHHADELVNPSDEGTLQGYQYYFYPITSFMPNGSGDMAMMMAMNGSGADHGMMMMDDNNMSDGGDTRIDPLFLAMAGFMGFATIVSFSILFLPKFGDNRSWKKAAVKGLPEDEDEMFSLSRVVGEAIQGKDCADRLACELGRAIRAMKLGQKPIRVVEAMLPPHLARQLSQVRQHMTQRNQCQLIACNPLKQKPKNNKKRPKALELTLTPTEGVST